MTDRVDNELDRKISSYSYSPIVIVLKNDRGHNLVGATSSHNTKWPFLFDWSYNEPLRVLEVRDSLSKKYPGRPHVLNICPSPPPPWHTASHRSAEKYSNWSYKWFQLQPELDISVLALGQHTAGLIEIISIFRELSIIMSKYWKFICFARFRFRRLKHCLTATFLNSVVKCRLLLLFVT